MVMRKSRSARTCGLMFLMACCWVLCTRVIGSEVGLEQEESQIKSNRDWPVLSPKAVGDIPFGISLDSLEKRQDYSLIPFNEDSENSAEPSSCYYLRIQQWPGVALMVENARIVRADVPLLLPLEPDASVVPSLDYLQNEEPSVHQLREQFPGLEIEPHAYFDLGVYLIHSDPEQEFALVIEYAEGKVLGLRAGKLPNVLWVEGCS